MNRRHFLQSLGASSLAAAACAAENTDNKPHRYFGGSDPPQGWGGNWVLNLAENLESAE